MDTRRADKLRRTQVWSVSLLIAIAAAIAPSAAYAATWTIWLEKEVASNTWQSSAYKYYLDGGRAWVTGDYHTPKIRTVSTSGVVLYSATGGYGGAIQMIHARAVNAKSSCTFSPYGGVAAKTDMICKYYM
ncbi:hypothetical protein GCM10025738_25840 [Microbacterium fluvii]